MQEDDSVQPPLHDGGRWTLQEPGGGEAVVELRDGTPLSLAERFDAWLLSWAGRRRQEAQA